MKSILPDNHSALQVRQNNVSAERFEKHSARQSFCLAGKAEQCFGRTIKNYHLAKQSFCLGIEAQ
ncbi:MAG: hypothetical protein ONB46_01085 [candidate division KSB1 bacterium]|nr:hypothetical protein [candidate division KSB1 bacterium]MDZ7364564.1 hypothetical protein [candidate division KSB1 bacterium]MDZ7405733.1 hypothetical protein [candidate division KSB1 bacterium]